MNDLETLSFGTDIEYVGPDEFEGEWVAPSDRELPYTFHHVSAGGTLSCLTRFNGRKRLAPEHPANDPAYWEVAE